MDLNGLRLEIKRDLKENENIFIHGIENSNQENIESIFTLGLFCHKYFSTLRTMRELGKSKDLEISDLDYCWCSFGNDYSVNVILAIPDFLTLDEKFLPLYPEDVATEIKLEDDGGHRTFFDIILGNGKTIGIIPKEFVYGAYLMRNDNKRVANLIYNPCHYSKLRKQEYAKFFEMMKDKFEATILGKYLKIASRKDLLNLESVLKSVLFFDEGKICSYTYDRIIDDLKIKKNNQR